MTDLIATRTEALRRLKVFTPGMGRRYANGRNHDFGPGRHTAVSGLSPWVRRRLVTETELVSAALFAHGPVDAAKFIEEVVWRGYFKGWLERRPQVWRDYRQGLEADLATLDQNRRLRRDVERATAGQTGLACFDAWAEELVETGYLHNHARMWFASIWIFTLELPWRLGADFFFRHLIDGDPASNTLGWRWVAGLHTRGKPYAATAQNIAAFTGGRFSPRPVDLAEVPVGLEATEPEGLPPAAHVRIPIAPRADLPTALLLTEEDCQIEGFPLADLPLRGAATLSASHLRSPLPVSDAVRRFEAAALADGAGRSGLAMQSLSAGAPQDIAHWAEGLGARQIVTAFLPQGPLRDWMDDAAPHLAARGIVLAEWQRDWDRAIWSHATAGFFKVRERIPRLIEELSLP